MQVVRGFTMAHHKIKSLKANSLLILSSGGKGAGKKMLKMKIGLDE